MLSIQLKFCRVEWRDFGCVTFFPDNTYVNATPHWQDPHYHVIAQRCGYANDLLAYCREHEFAHAFLAQELLDRASQVLDSLAHNEKVLPYGIAVMEEMCSQTFQRWMRANEEPIIAGVDWVGLKQKALWLVNGGK